MIKSEAIHVHCNSAIYVHRHIHIVWLSYQQRIDIVQINDMAYKLTLN